MKAKVPLHGWLVLDKPAGPSSAQAVGRVKRVLRPAKIGHGGTLDPAATGVLPLALGEATKTMQFMLDADKAYAFTVTFGMATTTDDAAGEVLAESSARPTTAEIGAVLPRFTGEISQLPPMVSALKVAGKRAYQLVRQGERPQLKPREVTVRSLELLGMDDERAHFTATVSKGTYIRSLARDMAEALGTVGHISALRRTVHGPFRLEAAITLEDLDKYLETGEKPPILPVDAALHGLVAYQLQPDEATALRHGRTVTNPAFQPGLARMYAGEALLAMAYIDGHGTAKPQRVFNLPANP